MSWIDDLEKAQRPAILVGGGARGAAADIDTVARGCNIPVFRTWNALDIVTDDSPVYAGTIGTYGGPGRNFGIQNCDLLLSLGCRMSGRITGGMPATFARGAKKYIVDVDPDILDRRWQQVQGDENVLMRAEDFLRDFDAIPIVDESWLDRCRGWLDIYDPVRPEHMVGLHHYGFVRRLSELLPADAIVCYDTGGNAIMMGHCFRSKQGQRIITSNGNTPMGGALCYAIGAAFAQPSRPVYCLIGDGGMQLNIQELQTIKHCALDVRIIVLNNKILGNTKIYQIENKMAQVACGPDGYSCPDFVAVARAYGIIANRWDAPTENLNTTVLGMRGPWLMEVEHADFCDYAPKMVRWDCPIEDMKPYLPRDEFRANMIVEPWKGWEDIK